MAYPYIYENSFDMVNVTPFAFDSETDSAGQLDIAHYKTLAGSAKLVPYTGAYSMRIVLSGVTTEAFVIEGDINTSAATYWLRCSFMFGNDFTGTVDDTFTLMELIESGTTARSTLQCRIVAATGVINLGHSATAGGTTTWALDEIERGKWYTVEQRIVGHASAGTLDFYLTKDGNPATSTIAAGQIASLDTADVTTMNLGTKDVAATTTGTILYDQFAYSTAGGGRIWPAQRYGQTKTLTTTGYAFVGPGTINSIAFLNGAIDDVLAVYDTDDMTGALVGANEDIDGSSIVAQLAHSLLANVTHQDVPVKVKKGAFIFIGDANRQQPDAAATGRATISLGAVSHYSDATVRHLGRNS